MMIQHTVLDDLHLLIIMLILYNIMDYVDFSFGISEVYTQDILEDDLSHYYCPTLTLLDMDNEDDIAGPHYGH